MNTTVTLDAVFEEAMKLRPEERLELADRLMSDDDSDDVPMTEATRGEILRRIADDRAGRTTRIPGEQALRQIRESVLGA